MPSTRPPSHGLRGPGTAPLSTRLGTVFPALFPALVPALTAYPAHAAAGRVLRSAPRRRNLLRALVLGSVALLAACAPAPDATADDTRSPATAADAGARPEAVVLQYHFVAEDTPRVTSVTPAELEAHLDHLDAGGFTVLPLPELIARIRAGEDVPPRSVAITFDDGYRSVYTNAFPMLRERGLPFTIFVNTAAIDAPGRQFSTWDQLAEMQRAGATIANHTVGHAYLVRRPPDAPRESDAAFAARMRAEITAAEDRIAEKLGVRHGLFAYPFGEYDHRLQAWIAEQGYIGIGQHSGVVYPGADFTALPRFPLSGDYADMEEFADKMRMHALPVRNATDLPDPLRATREPRPELVLQVDATGLKATNIACYATGQGRVDTTLTPRDGNLMEVVARARQPVRMGRSRYNCTAPRTDGSWAWFSQPWLRLADDGSAPP